MALGSVLLDSREPAWIRELTFGGIVPVAVTMLDAGDLWATTDTGEIIAVERKTASDLLGSLCDERLFPQLVRLHKATPWAYLVICGSLHGAPNGKCWASGKETGLNWWSVQGALITAQEIGVHVVYLASDLEYEAAILRLANRERGQMRVKPAREAAMISDAEAMLIALPGIGPEKAQALLAYCGTPAYALQYLSGLWDGPTAPGLGEGTRRRIRKALELPDNLALSVITLETGNPPVEKEKVTA